MICYTAEVQVVLESKPVGRGLDPADEAQHQPLAVKFNPHSNIASRGSRVAYNDRSSALGSLDECPGSNWFIRQGIREERGSDKGLWLRGSNRRFQCSFMGDSSEH
jgi:hypothetical protein